MKNKLLIILFLFSAPFLFSQTQKKITATVMSTNFILQGIDVVNLDAKIGVITNESGNFSIMANVGDQLMFISKSYEYKTIVLKEADFLNSNFIISLIKKPEELDEVVINKIPNIKLKGDNKYEQGKADDMALEKNAKKPIAVLNDGTIANGMDFMRIGGMILNIFKKDKEKTNKVPEIKFKALVNTNLDQDFFKKALGLKSDEIDLFLDYCDADVRSKEVITNPNPLKIMDFLFLKNVEFQKLPKK